MGNNIQKSGENFKRLDEEETNPTRKMNQLAGGSVNNSEVESRVKGEKNALFTANGVQ